MSEHGESTSSVLLPCPFCGHRASIKRGDFGEHFVTCDNKHCGGRLAGDCWQTTDSDAARAWNQRHGNKERNG